VYEIKLNRKLLSYNFSYYRLLTGQIQPNKKSKTTKEEAFNSWVEAIHETASMNVVTVTRIDHDSRA
jgi:hypothetical protein